MGKMAAFIKKHKILIIIVAVVVLLAAAYFISKNISKKAGASGGQAETTVQVMRGDISVTISGTGTVEPIARYDIIPLVKGNILEAPFEEGMQVKKDDLLYRIDDSDLSYNIRKSENNIKKMELSNQDTLKSAANQVVTAPADGRITSLTVREGEQVGNNSRLGEIVNDKRITALVPFHKTQADKIKPGQKAWLEIESYFWSIEGTVTYVSNTPVPVAGGGAVYNVEIEIENPGAFSEGMEVKGVVETAEGKVYSASTGTTSFAEKKSVFSQTSGKVKKLYVKENEWVKAGQKILEIENESIDNTIYKNSLDLEDAKLSLDALKKQLDDYYILSPTDGTVIKKYYKEGDTVNNTGGNVILMTVADLSKMVFTVDVDELDVAKVAVGQKVNVTADALPDVTFEGKVTNVAMEGKSQNGVTTYPVEITISEPGQLRPGMNVNAEILVQSKSNVLYLPVAAVTKMGGKTFVTLADDSGKEPPERAQALQGENRRPDGNKSAPGPQNARGRQLREVTVGINNDDYIEIVSGLNEGDVVYMPLASGTGAMQGGFGRPGGSMGFPGGPGGGTVIRMR